MNEDLLKLLIEKAALKSEYRPWFYQTLLQFKVYIMLSDKASKSSRSETNKTSITTWQTNDGGQVIPVFSSLTECNTSQNDITKHIQMNLKELFQITLGAQFIINPYSTFSKEVTSEEVKALLNEKIDKAECLIFNEENSSFVIRQPKKYPFNLVRDLCAFFSHNEIVTISYVVEISKYEIKNVFNLLIGIGCESDESVCFHKLSSVIQKHISEDEHVDIIQLGKSKEFDSYFQKIQPFYVRSN